MSSESKIGRFSPAEHQAQRERAEEAEREAQQRAQDEAARVRRAVARILDTDDGRVFWKLLFDRCGWVKPVLMRGTVGGDISPVSTEAAAAQREVYRELRKLAPPDLLARAEFFAEHDEPEKPQQPKGEGKDA